MNRFFIDPSIVSMGWAFWNYEDYQSKNPPTATGLIKPDGCWKNWLSRSYNQVDKLEQIIDAMQEYKGDHNWMVFCEAPQFMEFHRGLTAARSGSLVKLSHLVGEIHYMCKSSIGGNFKLISIPEWKGQLPKSVVNYRIRSILGKENCKKFHTDIWDAVGMGLWQMGKL